MLDWLKRRSTGSPAPAAGAASPRGAAELRTEGNAWLDKGDLAKAEGCYRQAVTADATDALALINLAFVLNEQQRHAEARLHALQATSLAPDSVDALFVLANAQVQEPDWPAATASLERVLQLKPDFEPAYGMLCRAFAEQGLLDRARATIQRGLGLNSSSGEFHFYLGNLETAAGEWDAAVASYGRALALAPAFSEAHQNLGRALLQLGRQAEAIDSLKRGVASAPTSAEAHFKLGSAFQQMGQFEAAAKSFHAGLVLAPRRADVHDKLGLVLAALGDKASAARCHRQAIALQPDIAGFHSNLGMALHGQDALASYREALRLDPRFSVAHSNMGVVLYEQGDISGAVDSFRAAVALEPERLDVRSKLLFVSTFDESCSPEQYRAEAEAYGALASRLATPFSDWPSASAREASLPLRVGLVSGDLRSHPVGHFLEALISHLPRQRIELIAYATDPRQDALTERIRPHFAQWRSLVGLSDELAAQLIRNDGVQLLVDLAGHTANNRLPVFAWRPAPVQLTWLGYLATTGVTAIDYVIADSQTLPESEESGFTEEIWRLPESYLCFTPPADGIEVGPLPALSNARITFGSFNNLTKMNDAVVALWARVLAAVPDSRLFLKYQQLAETPARQRVVERFAIHGIRAERLILEGPVPRSEYLKPFQRVDIALDPFPYPGITTSVENLWMGVPVLTLAGKSFLSRQGVGLLMSAGLSEWIAVDAEDYVARAAAHASDTQKLADLRSGLRQKVLASPIFDAPRFAFHFEAALRSMLQKCRERPKQIGGSAPMVLRKLHIGGNEGMKAGV